MPPTEAEIAAGEQGKQTQEQIDAAKATAEAKEKAEAAAAGGKKEEITVAEALKGEKPKEAAVKMVPEAVLIDARRENKEAVQALQAQIDALKKEPGGSKLDLKSIAEKHKVDLSFLEEVASAITAQAKIDARAEAEEVSTSKVKPLEAKEQQQQAAAESARIDKVFGEHYDRALEQLPEFKDVASREVIKTLTLDPKNASKTFSQILEEAYGHLIKGKRTIENARPSGANRDAGPIDMERAAKDPAYFKEIMSDPTKKAEYNKGLEKRLPI